MGDDNDIATDEEDAGNDVEELSGGGGGERAEGGRELRSGIGMTDGPRRAWGGSFLFFSPYSLFGQMVLGASG